MEDAPPEEVDVIVVGTGMTEAILAAACARAGKRVLHLDAHEYYGSRNASFGLRPFEQFLLRRKGDAENIRNGDDSEHSVAATTDGAIAETLNDGIAATQLQVVQLPDGAEHVSFLGFAEDQSQQTGGEAQGGQEGAEELFKLSHRYNIDLTPQLLLCSGDMVSVLRSSGVSAYLEFKPIQAHLYDDAGALSRVPCSKADIFANSALKLVEKRQLMRFLQACAAMQTELEPDVAPMPQSLAAPDAAAPPAARLDASFASFMHEMRLPHKLQTMALHSILCLDRPLALRDGGGGDGRGGGGGGGDGGGDGDGGNGSGDGVSAPTAPEGIVAVCRHLRSLGQFGPTAFLGGFYGTAELPQAFCRLCAVWAGTYMLGNSAYTITLRDGAVAGIRNARGHSTRCEWLVLNGDVRVSNARQDQSERAARSAHGREAIARCVCVLDRAVLGGADETLCFASLFAGSAAGDGADGYTVVFALQQDASAAVCPNGKVLLHLSASATDDADPRALLEPVLKRLLSAQRSDAIPDAADAEAEAEADADGGAEAAATARTGPRVLWGAFFSLPLRSPLSAERSWAVPSNLLCLDDPPLSATCDGAVASARGLFRKICPDADFLPPREQEEGHD